MISRPIAVTGAGGFIGRAVCQELLALGFEVRALVGPPGDSLAAPPDVSSELRADILDGAALDVLLRGNVEAVIHLAGPPSVRSSFDDPLAYVRSHTEGTTALLQACRRNRVERFVYVSSAEVYGRPGAEPVHESHELEARSPYAAAKIGAEQMVRSYGHAYGFHSAIVRPFSVYGTGMGPHALIPAILRQIGATASLRLADLRPERDYVHVNDVARGIVMAVQMPLAQTIAINLGSGIATSVRDLAQTLLEIAGEHQVIEQVSASGRPGNADIMRLVADRQRAADTMGWTPTISLAVGLRDMLLDRAAVS